MDDLDKYTAKRKKKSYLVAPLCGATEFLFHRSQEAVPVPYGVT